LFERGVEGVIVRTLLLVAKVNATLGEKLILDAVAVMSRSKTTVTTDVAATPNAPFTGVWLTTSEAAYAVEIKPNGTRRRRNTSLFIRVICKIVI